MTIHFVLDGTMIFVWNVLPGRTSIRKVFVSKLIPNAKILTSNLKDVRLAILAIKFCMENALFKPLSLNKIGQQQIHFAQHGLKKDV